MNEGQQLRAFIDTQKQRKVAIADALGMTRSNLYQLFESQTLAPETKEKFEAYFGQKIFDDCAHLETSVQSVQEARPVQKEKNSSADLYQRKFEDLLIKTNEQLTSVLNTVLATITKDVSEVKKITAENSVNLSDASVRQESFGAMSLAHQETMLEALEHLTNQKGKLIGKARSSGLAALKSISKGKVRKIDGEGSLNK